MLENISKNPSKNFASEASYVYYIKRLICHEFLNETFLLIFKHCVAWSRMGPS